MARIVVTGRTGQVVSALLERGGLRGDTVIALGRPQLELENPNSIADAIEAACPDIVISAAAYTAVDKAETEPERAMAVNGLAPATLATATDRIGCPVIHLSTDYVFDGRKSAPYLEDDETGPLGSYGISKLAGEQGVREATANHAIVRTCWVYSPFSSNFLKTMLRLAGERPLLRVVSDQIGTPTSALDIADALLVMGDRLVAEPGQVACRGTFHMSGAGEASWADFAEEIMAASAHIGGPSVPVERISTANYPTPARRPANSRLGSDKLATVFGLALPDWRDSTRAVVSQVRST